MSRHFRRQSHKVLAAGRWFQTADFRITDGSVVRLETQIIAGTVSMAVTISTRHAFSIQIFRGDHSTQQAVHLDLSGSAQILVTKINFAG